MLMKLLRHWITCCRKKSLIVELVQKHCPQCLLPAHDKFCDNVDEAHKFFFSKCKDGTCSYKAITLGCPKISVKAKVPKAVKESAQNAAQTKKSDLSESSEDDILEKDTVACYGEHNTLTKCCQ